MGIKFSEDVVPMTDLKEIQIWNADQGVADVGMRLIGEIFQRIETLEMHPEPGRIVPEFGQPNLRELIQVPFRIIYRRDPGKVRIVRIWRSERLIQLPGEP